MLFMEQGPPVNLLSAGQLRFLARVRALRPTAELQWRGDASGWSPAVEESHGEAPRRPLLTANLDRNEMVKATRSWV
jgi:hypothetical protein